MDTLSQALQDELRETSARLGTDILFIQGPGGNISIKSGDELWIKASGTWLANARKSDIFVPLALHAVRERIAAGLSEDFASTILGHLAPPGLRPSIETALHGLLPYKTVIHAHAVDVLTTTVLEDGRARVDRALAGLPWAWVGYHRPGKPLADAVAAALRPTPVPILILENHGIVVGAETPLAAEALLRDVADRLRLALRPLDPVEPGGTPDDSYALETAMSSLMRHPDIAQALCDAPLFPDQVVFMGGAIPVCATGETFADVSRRIGLADGASPVLICVPAVGAFARRDRTPAAQSIIETLFEIGRRIPPGVKTRGLPPEATAMLLGWDAEKYRQVLNNKPPAS
jgi:ribulose-5-phosphate 4-epimerase/fuculose-1-phosphate aldolase